MYPVAKRLIDIAAAVLTLPVWGTLSILCALYVVIVSPGNPFYRSLRVGLHGEDMSIYKIRTMVPDADKIGTGTTARNDPRFIPGAQFIRRVKFDEMPQFFSVLIGTLSLVGPRPELRFYVDLYTREERDLVLSVKPGIVDYGTLAFPDLQALLGSGPEAEKRFIEELAQRKIDLRLKYVRERSLLTDLHIMVMTPVTLIGSFLRKSKARA